MSIDSLLPLLVLLGAYLPPALVLSWIDGREQRLPNRWVATLTIAVTAALGLSALLVPSLRPAIRTAAVLAIVLGVGAIIIALFAPALIGMGDAKTLPVVVMMSATLGGEVLIATLLGIALLGGIIGIVVIAATRRAGERFAFGPVLLAGPFLGLLGAPAVTVALGG